MVHMCERVWARGHTWGPYLAPFHITVDLTFWDGISAIPSSIKLPGSPVSAQVHHHWDYRYALSPPCMPVFYMDAENSELQSLSCAACSLIPDPSPNPSFHDFSVTLFHFTQGAFVLTRFYIQMCVKLNVWKHCCSWIISTSWKDNLPTGSASGSSSGSWNPDCLWLSECLNRVVWPRSYVDDLFVSEYP